MPMFDGVLETQRKKNPASSNRITHASILSGAVSIDIIQDIWSGTMTIIHLLGVPYAGFRVVTVPVTVVKQI
jgi:hypothetical protein